MKQPNKPTTPKPTTPPTPQPKSSPGLGADRNKGISRPPKLPTPPKK